MSRLRFTRPRRLASWLVLGALALATPLLSLALALGLAMAWYGSELPPLDKATDYRPRQHLQVLSADGVEIAQFGAERRIFVPIAQVPQQLKDALLAVEDTRFYSHPGISWRGLARALLANLDGGVPQGGSTITQQVARTFFLSTRRTPERKIKEALLALQLERRLSKDQILELYLNQVYFGERAYGVGAAAQVYYGKTLAELSLAESAMIAGLPQNPIYANPVVNPARARQRQAWVLTRMLRTGFIEDEQRRQALAEPAVLQRSRPAGLPAPHVAEMARQAVVEQLGDRAYTEGIRVFTSLRADDQRAAHAALRQALIRQALQQPWRGPEVQAALPEEPEAATRAAALLLKDLRDDEDLRLAVVLQAGPTRITARLASGEQVALSGTALRVLQPALARRAPAAVAIRRGSVLRLLAGSRAAGTGWQVVQWPEGDAAFVALDPASGRVRALVGGFDAPRQPVNHVTQATPRPGPLLMPFVASAAFEHRVMPETLVPHAPLSGSSSPQPWIPDPALGRFGSEISVREALLHNVVSVAQRLQRHVGAEVTREWLGRFGFDRSLPQMAEGNGPVSPLQLASAYAVLANGGHAQAPVLIERIVDSQGRILFQAPSAPALDERTRVLPARNVFLVNSLLGDAALRGSAAALAERLPRSDLHVMAGTAARTGMPDDTSDAWCAGFVPGWVGVAWIGPGSPQGAGAPGAEGALWLWAEAAGAMLQPVPQQPATPPPGVLATLGDWRYSEWASGGFVSQLAQDDPPPAGGASGWSSLSPARARP